LISQNLITIGDTAKIRRKTLGLSQTEAAAQIQAHRNEISRIETGKYTGNIVTYTRYLDLLGLSLQTTIARSPVLEDLDGLFEEANE